MTHTETMPSALMTNLCGCVVDRVLTEDQSYLAVGRGGRQTVLKIIDSDCLLRGALHPNVRDRLSRVRELAHASVANLLGVERDADQAWLMWEYVEGMAFDAYAVANRSPRDVASAARELVLAVDLLHMQGIVHGALIANNAIVAETGVVRLTHISPLLYNDPSVDIECIWNLLDQVADELGERGAALAEVAADCRARNLSLRQLATRLGGLIDIRDARNAVEKPVEPPSKIRKRSLIGAAVAATLGLAVAWGVWHAIEGGTFNRSDSVHVSARAQVDR